MAVVERRASRVEAGLSSRVDELYRSLRVEAAEWEREGGVPASVYERLGSIGAFAARWPDRARGPGDMRTSELILRETALASLGGCVAVGTHMETYFRALARSEFGAAVWDETIAGRRSGALAVTERTGGSFPANCETLARRVNGDWVLSGHKHYCSNMRAADDVAVFARTARRRDLSSFTLFIVPVDAAGVRVTPHKVVGAAASATAMIDLAEVEVGDERRVGGVGSGLPLLLELLRAERVGAACGALAVAELCFEIALAFANSRQQPDGAPLRNRQVI